MNIRNPEKFEYAELLYMKKVPQKTICEKIGVTPATLTKWKQEGCWEEKRAARSVSVDSLVSKLLSKADKILETEDASADDIAKIISQLKNFKGRITPDDKVATLMDFGDWLFEIIGTEAGVTGEVAQLVTRLQDIYILKKLRANG